VGAALWFLTVPLRLRSLPVALLPAIAAAPVSAWALSKDPFSKSLQSLAAKESVAGEFGLFLLLTAVVLLAVAFSLAIAAIDAMTIVASATRTLHRCLTPSRQASAPRWSAKWTSKTKYRTAINYA